LRKKEKKILSRREREREKEITVFFKTKISYKYASNKKDNFIALKRIK